MMCSLRCPSCTFAVKALLLLSFFLSLFLGTVGGDGEVKGHEPSDTPRRSCRRWITCFLSARKFPKARRSLLSSVAGGRKTQSQAPPTNLSQRWMRKHGLETCNSFNLKNEFLHNNSAYIAHTHRCGRCRPCRCPRPPLPPPPHPPRHRGS